MRAFDFIFILCSSLLVSSSSQSTTEINDAFLKAEPQVDQLISGDFQVKTQKGKWLIFFGSTMCIHCKAFTPDWLTLQQETKNSYKFVNMGKVDCPTNPDLCKDITGYPTLKLYRDGQFIEEIENRELKNLRSYVKAAHDESLALSKDQGYAKLNELVGQELSGDSKVNPDGKVIDLTDKDFEKLTTAQPWVLMFYAPW
jgi:thiol-disulfide isomerase/thioredoxin